MHTCFVVSPIGEDGSPERANADDLLELVIIPALEPFGFDVVRSDKIVSSGLITSEIIELVQNADLCIVDLTGHNANVFYECGRRHETARPFIQMIRRGETLPFDVAGIRTLFYDLTDPRAVHNAVLDVKKYVETVTRAPSASSRTAVSVSSLGDAIDRLERKLDRLATSVERGPVSPVARDSSSASLLSRPQRRGRISPSEDFLQAISVGDWARAAEATRQLHERDGNAPWVLAAAANIASEGEQVGAVILTEALDELVPWAPNNVDNNAPSQIDALLALANYYMRAERGEEGLARFGERLSRIGSSPDLPPEARAMAANTENMLAFAAGAYQRAAEAGERAVTLSPESDIYQINLSMSYEATEDLARAATVVERVLREPLTDSVQRGLEQAIDVFAGLGKRERVEELLRALVEVDPERAHFKAFLARMELDSNGQEMAGSE